MHHMDWPGLFEAAFRFVEPRLERVIDFSGCRESWLQAEICLFLREHGSDVSVNDYALGGGCKADFHATAPSQMVAELKLLGNGYAAKCFDGTGQLDRFQPAPGRDRVPITAANLTASTGYFLHDCARLARIRGVRERYMILLVDRRGVADRLGRALLAARLSQDEWTFTPASGSYLVRLWRLDTEL
jgi:hypothetical protein